MKTASIKLQKTSMAVWLPTDIQQKLREKNWLVDLIGDRVPPEVGITKLRNIDPEIALSLAKIYHVGPDDVKEINGRKYIIIEADKKKKYIVGLDIENGELVSFDKKAVSSIVEERAVQIGRDTAAKINGQVRNLNKFLETIDIATSNITLLPLQLGRLSTHIGKRVEDLNAIINYSRAKMEAPKPEAMGEWERGIEQSLLTNDLDEVSFVDTVLHNYKYRYKEMVDGLKNETIPIPANIDNPDLLKQKLINIGELAFQEYINSIEAKKRQQAAPGVPFDIESVEFGPLQEIQPEDVPSGSQKATGYRNYQAYLKSLKRTILSSEKNRDLLVNVNNALMELGQKLGGLENGQRSNAYLTGTTEGKMIVADLTNFINNRLSSFITQYKSEVVDKDGNIDTKKMGRKGSVGNALLVVSFVRLYRAISEILKKISSDPNNPTDPTDSVEAERVPVEADPVEEVPLEEGVEASSKNKIKRMSELLWIPFKERMRLK